MEKLEAQTEVIVEQRRQIAEQERQLRLLPDLQKQAGDRAKEAELKHVEAQALTKQVEALELKHATEMESLKATLEAAKCPWWKRAFSGK